MKKKLFLISMFSILICNSQAIAEYNAGKLGEAIGGYVIATDIIEKLSSSQCGYAVRKKYSREATINEVIPYLRKQDQKDLRSMLNSNSFQNDLAENNDFLSNFMSAGRQDGLDKNTLCGMLVSNVAMMYQKSKQQWLFAKENYLK